jgi:STAM-binding protein
MAGYRITSLGPNSGPMSIEEIVLEAESQLTDYNPNIPLRFWLRTADAVQKQAKAYEKDGNEEEAYKFFYRHAILVMRNLAFHPELKQQPVPAPLLAAFRRAKDDVNANLAHLELLKPKIKRRYDGYQDMISRSRSDSNSWAQEERNNAYNVLVGGQRVSTGGNRSRFSAATTSDRSEGVGGYLSGAGLYGRTRVVDPEDGVDLAVQLAHHEFRNAGAPQRTLSLTREPTTPLTSETGGTFFADDSEDDLSSHIRAVGNRRDQAFARKSLEPESQRPTSSNRAPQYPAVPKPLESNTTNWYDSSPAAASSPPPVRPPKTRDLSESPSSPPPIPLKQALSPTADLTDTSNSDPPLNDPHQSLVLDPRKFTFKATAFTESGTPLRTVFMNSKLRSRFLTIALANTSRGLETCGILCGRLLANAFFVFKLVIPEQESTSDTCETVNEGALFDYCDKEDLLTLGWIHTHPTQTCFMSSRDLHTHGGYQVQLSESIAIVCAPKHAPS